MEQDLFLKMMSTTEDEINAMVDTGRFNGIIMGYMVATLRQLDYSQDDIAVAVDALADIFDSINAAEARRISN